MTELVIALRRVRSRANDWHVAAWLAVSTACELAGWERGFWWAVQRAAMAVRYDPIPADAPGP